MKSRRVFTRIPAVALLVGLPLAALGGSGAGCARIADVTPPGGLPDSGSSSTGNTATASSSSSSDLGATSRAPQPLGVRVIGDKTLCTGGPPSVGPSPLRRISRVEYNNMVRDLLQDTTRPADQFVSESPLATGVNFDTNTYTAVLDTLIPQQYLQSAETLADTAANEHLSAVVTECGGQQNDACVQKFIDDFAGRAFRGQYDSTESQQLFTLYTTIKAQFDFATGIQAVITAVLTSPRFLFVLEFGQTAANGNVVLLAPDELATRLSLFLWRSLPDATLLSDAQSGNLATTDGIKAEAVRMLKDPKAQSGLEDFATQWMKLQNTKAVTKDTQFTSQNARVQWSAQLASDLQTETLTTYYNEAAVETGADGRPSGTLNELLSSNQSYVNANVANFYGVSGGTGAFAKMNVNPAGQQMRAGILTNASVLATAAHTSLPSPVLRGRLVREQVLCDPVPDPPAAIAGVPIPPPPSSIAGGQTTNGTYHQHSTNPVCYSCHKFMDPIGFGFANFDATGAFQANDSNGAQNPTSFPPIDASGTIYQNVTGEMADTPFQGAVDMAQKLATSAQVQECFALQQFRYALGRIESEADGCSLQQAFQTFSQSNFNLQTMLLALVQSDAFRYRNVETAGSDCK